MRMSAQELDARRKARDAGTSAVRHVLTGCETRARSQAIQAIGYARRAMEWAERNGSKRTAGRLG